MALALLPVADGIVVSGNRVTRSFQATLTTYTALGEPLTARMLGLSRLEYVDVRQEVYTGVLLLYDVRVAKLRAFTWTAPATNAAEELAGGTDLSWLTGVRLTAQGF